jgi:ABC-type Fe2+-enterobactin transport system substrate-binding protein
MQRKVFSSAIAIGIALTLSACGPGFDAPTRNIRQVTDGIDTEIKTGNSDIKVRNLVVVTQADGSAVLVGSIVNNGTVDDALLRITIGGVPATITAANITMKRNDVIRFEGESSNAKAVSEGVNLVAGSHTPVSLFFGTAGSAHAEVLVRSTEGIYANVTK